MSRVDSSLRIEGQIPIDAVEVLNGWIDRNPGSSVRVLTVRRGSQRFYFHRVGRDLVVRSALGEALDFARS